MGIIVQKYGGTSVSTESSRQKVAKNAISAFNEGHQVVVVVSAMGRKGAPYATDTLIGLYKEVINEHATRELDLLMSCGETISATVMAGTIRAHGVDSAAITGFQAGIVTDDIHGDANVIEVKTDKILHHLKANRIVVVTGFQGITSSGDITTLGRGGSDTTAAILGEALDADAIEIYTDVDGVMTADPRLVPEAKVIGQISYEECYQMAVDGAKVVDHKAVEVARRSGKILKIKNTFKACEGTTISRETAAIPKTMQPKIITAIASKDNIVQFTINIPYDDDRNEAFLNAFEEAGVSMDLINFFEDQKIFTINEQDLGKAHDILNALDLEYTTLEDCCKLTAVGYKIHGVPGVMKRIVLSLTKAGIEILQSGDSHTTIACLIRKSSLEKAIQALHKEFQLND
ncbi:aspartate kinase [Fusibacter sp. JL216-2]|uniref:aspartate kinase n=1 Tax=Fusibacter sp. JL216-2 TaxID=3071453 RepID=UPI003D32C164